MSKGRLDATQAMDERTDRGMCGGRGLLQRCYATTMLLSQRSRKPSAASGIGFFQVTFFLRSISICDLFPHPLGLCVTSPCLGLSAPSTLGPRIFPSSRVSDIRIRSDPVFLPALDLDPFFKFLWIRNRFQPGSWNKKKSAERALKAIYQRKT